MRREDIMYKPHIAEYNSAEIVLIPRDREISNTQEGGFDPKWFEHEVMQCIRQSDVKGIAFLPHGSDRENRRWFRQMHEPSGFWGHFFAPYMAWMKCRGEIIKSHR